MLFRNWLFIISVLVLGVTGLYLILTSGRLQVDPYSLVLFLIVVGFIVYLYLLYVRRQV